MNLYRGRGGVQAQAETGDGCGANQARHGLAGTEVTTLNPQMREVLPKVTQGLQIS